MSFGIQVCGNSPVQLGARWDDGSLLAGALVQGQGRGQSSVTLIRHWLRTLGPIYYWRKRFRGGLFLWFQKSTCADGSQVG